MNKAMLQMLPRWPRLTLRSFVFGLALTLAFLAGPAQAQVTVSFHSLNGSVLFGRYPHTFIVLQGTLEATGEPVEGNFGFFAKEANLAVLRGPVEQIVMSETPKTIRSSNRHFAVSISDATYRRMWAEIEAWRDAPGAYYNLDHRNCIHFVGRMAQLAGVRVEYPQNMLRRPKAWLDFINTLNPALGEQHIN